MNHFTIYRDDNGYCAFPSLAVDAQGVIYCVFRHAPTRKSKTHIDTRSKAILVKSIDQGETWETVSEIKDALHSGIQDPSIKIVDGQFLVNYFTWVGRAGHTKKAKKARVMGCFVRRSLDAKWWDETFNLFAWDNLFIAVSEPPIVVDDSLILAGYADTGGGGDTCLLIKTNKDLMGDYQTIKIAHDPSGGMNYQEPALLDCGQGHLLCLMRAATSEGSMLYQAHSWDGGQTWQPPRKTGIQGFPPNLIKLPNRRLLCTYGYRKHPYAIRACISYDDGLTWDTENEVTIRDGAKGWDMGYPSTIRLEGGDLLTAYYWYTRGDKIRRIECTRWKPDERTP